MVPSWQGRGGRRGRGPSRTTAGCVDAPATQTTSRRRSCSRTRPCHPTAALPHHSSSNCAAAARTRHSVRRRAPPPPEPAGCGRQPTLLLLLLLLLLLF